MPTTESTETATETTGTTTEATETATETTDTTNESTETATETTETTTEATSTTTGTTNITSESTETATETADGESDADAKLTAFVRQSSRRTAVLERLVTGPASASEVAARDAPSVEGVRGVTGTLSASKTESTTEELRDRGLVELLVDDDTRVYSLTAKGERILFALEWDEG